MGKYRRYKNIVEMFLASEKGKRVLNFCYSWGASIIIIGAMFKILHLPYANYIIGIAMSFEAVVFFIFGFERPSADYNWEEVFPVLKSKNPLDRPDFEHMGGGHGPVVISGGSGGDLKGAHAVVGGTSFISGGSGGGGSANVSGVSIDVSEQDAKTLSESIQKLNEAASSISKMADMTEATEGYLEQISAISQKMERFNQITSSLTEASDTLLTSYRTITDNSGDIDNNSRGYVNQMEQLNRNIMGLNTIYELQLKGVSSQIENIERINSGLSRIRDMYDGSVTDSSLFRSENEKMAQLLTQLNSVYSRLLQAMTVNMPAGGYGNPTNYQQPYQQQQQQQQQPQQPQNPYQQPQGNPYNNPPYPPHNNG